MSEEQACWQRIVRELTEDDFAPVGAEIFKLEYIAAEIGVSIRQVTNWKAGTDRPLGFNAVRLYLFHAKRRTPVPIEKAKSRTPVPFVSK